VIALKLPNKVAKEICHQEQETSRNMLARLKAKLGFDAKPERWLTITSVDNPLLVESDKFGTLVAEELSTATGTKITDADLAVSASVPLTEN
jgi:hypothetical protein